MKRPEPGQAVAFSDDNSEDAAQALFRRIVACAQDGIVVQDMEARIEWINPACERLYGWTLDQMRGRKPQEFILPPETRPSDAEIAAFRYDAQSALFGRYQLSRNIRRDGSTFWNQQSFALLDLGAAGQKVVITCRDVTDQVLTEQVLRQAQVDLRHAAHHDDLTGLANRKKLAEYLAAAPVRAAMAQGVLGVLVIDIDKFKEINDSLGHGAGDRTLAHVASVLARVAGPRDLACRTGGDEFLLVCDVPEGGEGLQARAEAVLRALEPPFHWRDQTVRIGASIGACLASGTPMPRSMPPRRAGAGAWCITAPISARRCARARRSRATCERRSRATSSRSTFSRSFASIPGASAVARRSSAGTTPAVACSPRQPFSRRRTGSASWQRSTTCR
jgi:diguanylate cyclase (GGDEF)-like protein/PAS domain S-box-containing protein